MKIALAAATLLVAGCVTPTLPPTVNPDDNRPSWEAAWTAHGRGAPMAPLEVSVYRNATGPLGWDSPTYKDLPQLGEVESLHEVHGESCQWSLSLPFPLPIFVNLDSSAYQAAYLQALRSGQVQALVDVRADRNVTGILSVYWKVCTRLTATGVRFVRR